MGKCLRVIKELINSLNPYRIIACYVIFFVVRAEGNVKSTSVEQPIEEILGSIIAGGGVEEEESLIRDIPWDDATCERIPHHGNANEVSSSNSQMTVELPLPNVISDNAKNEESKYQQGTSLNKRQENNGFTDKIKEKPFLNIFTELPILAATSNNIRNEICRRHSRIFVHQLKRYKLWALQMYDSSAKLPPGILRGNTNQLGDFDQCLSIGKEKTSNIEGKYCLASVDIEATPFSYVNVDSLKKAVYYARSYDSIKSKASDPGHLFPRFTTINWGICVPASCSSTDVEQALLDALQDYNETSGISFNVCVDPDMCYVTPDAKQSYSTFTICTMLFFGVVICISIMATLFERRRDFKEKGQLQRIIMAFSIHKNIAELTADLPVDGDINCIYGIRAICSFMVYALHKGLLLYFKPYSNRVDLTEITNQSWSIIYRAPMVYTDSFLLLSGLLSSFNLTKEIERKKHIDWIKKCIARFMRLTPALLALILFNAYLMEHLGTGPLWNLTIKRDADICKENSWKNILYIQTFFPFEQMCAVHTHYLALDMQLSLLSPLLVTLLWQWRVFGISVLLFLYTLSAALRYFSTLQNQLSLVIYHGISVTKFYQSTNVIYQKSLHRATPYLVGVGLGHIMHKTGQNVHIPKFAVGAGWLLAAYFAYFSIFSPSHLTMRNYEYNVHETALHTAFSPITWSLSLGWLIWACFTGHGGIVNKFLCNKFLVMLSRISYAVYLTQFTVFFYNIGTLRTSQHFSLAKMVDIYEVLTIIIISVIVTLLFDLPMQEIKTILMGGGKITKYFYIPGDPVRART